VYARFASRLGAKRVPWVLCRLLLIGLATGVATDSGKAFGMSDRAVRLAAWTAPEESAAAGTYRGHAPAADAAERVFTLTLDPDGSATLTTLFIGKGKATERGHWKQNGIEVVLTFDPLGSSQPPRPITFRFRHHALQPTHWDPSEWGRKGPPVLSRLRAPESPTSAA
jgi:hypothetical protein